MPDNMKKVLLIGAGPMAVAYAKVMSAQAISYTCVGRGESSAKNFENLTGKQVVRGGIQAYLQAAFEMPDCAIVATSVLDIAEITIKLVRHGVKRILVEKPAGINVVQIQQVEENANQYGAEVYVAYNRRFYTSTLAAEKIIEKDGGILSFCFEFTEWMHKLILLDKPAQELANWLFNNSTHVMDLAFYIGGYPKQMTSYAQGPQSQLGKASVFSGAGLSNKNALFSYKANWMAPGRWGLEVMTTQHRLVFQPIEKLSMQDKGSLEIREVELDNILDIDYKPGLYLQVKAFLEEKYDRHLVSIQEQAKMAVFYDEIWKGGRLNI